MLRANEQGFRADINREERRGQNAALTLLQKASSQLRGERVPLKTREEDELAQYLSSLTQKTSQQVKSINYEEYGEISISSGAEPMTPTTRPSASPVIGAGSKFLKKKNLSVVEVEATASRRHGIDARQKSQLQPGSQGASSGTRSKTDVASLEAAKKSLQPGQTSSALNKAKALTTKITQRSAAPWSARHSGISVRDSDTDESTSLQHHGIDARSRSGSASDPSIGHDRDKFIKKRPVAAPASPDKTKAPESPENASAQDKARNKIMGKQNFSRQVQSSSQLYLTSEDESLAEFIQCLSGSDESAGQKVAVKQKNSKGLPEKLRRPSPEAHITKHRSPSPARYSSTKGYPPFRRSSPHPSLHQRSSQDSDVADSITSEVAESIHGKIIIADSLSLDEPIQFKVMGASSFGQSVHVPARSSKVDHSSKQRKVKASPFKRANSPGFSSKKKSKKDRKHMDKNRKNIFHSFGVHTVEELIGGVSEKENSDESEILTEPLNRKRQRDYSTSQILAEVHSSTTPQQQVSYASHFEDSISEKIGEEQRDSRLPHQRSVSDVDKETGTEDYSEDFASETISVAQASEEEESSHYQYSEEELGRGSAATDAQKGRRKLVVEQRSVEIQTTAPPGLHYQWNTKHTGVSILGPSLGLDRTDPTPVAATVISPDALEAMTAYSPATLALLDMMKQQMNLIKQFVAANERLYHSLTDSNTPDYHYTTWEDTKAYIEKHRKPRLTFKEALKMVVSPEMNQ